MAKERYLNGRFQQRIDIEENWKKAVNFVPLEGEIIVYKDLNQIKIGDGISTLNQLNFVGGSSGGVGEKTDPVSGDEIGGEIFNDYDNNQAIGPHTSAFGTRTSSGIRGYYWEFADEERKQVRIKDKKDDFNWLVASDEIPSYLGFYNNKPNEKKVHYDTSYQINSIEGDVLTLKSPISQEVENDGTGIVWNISSPGNGLIEVSTLSDHTEGYETVAFGSFGAHAEGSSTMSVGKSSHAEGEHTIAQGEASHAEGYQTRANGEASHAEGYQTHANGKRSHAEGFRSTAPGNFAHAEGSETDAFGEYSHAEGYYTTAYGLYSHAEGERTYAEGYGSHAEGQGTMASGANQHVQGRYNIKDNTYAHIVGNGTENASSNAHTVDWSGNAWYAGKIKIGGFGYYDANASELATKKDVSSKANAVHTHKTSDVTGLESSLDDIKLYAAECAKSVKNDLLNGAGEAYDTLKELGGLIDENSNAIDALNKVATSKADAIHNHNDLYYTKKETENLISTTVEGLEDALDIIISI